MNSGGIYKLEELFDFSNGLNADRSAFGAGVPFANTSEVIGNQSLGANEMPGRIRVSSKVLARYALRFGDVLFNRSSETADEIALSCVYLDHAPAVFGGFIFRARPKGDQLDPRFAQYALRASSVRTQLQSLGQGGIRSNVGQRDLKRIVLQVPPIQEQLQIVAKLANADELIQSLERLIAKKQAIQQGMLQQLLTGKTRLPGFEGDWAKGRLGALYARHNVVVDPRLSRSTLFRHFSLPAFDAGKQPIIEYGDSIDSHKFAVPKSALLVSKLNPRIPRIWAPKHVGRNAVASTEFIVAMPVVGVDASFLKWLFQSAKVAGQMKLLATGTTGSHTRIHPTQVADIAAQWPGHAEQVAIAEAIDSAEDEIAALARQLVGTRSIKQGMMQELLTGRTRLTTAEDTA